VTLVRYVYRVEGDRRRFKRKRTAIKLARRRTVRIDRNVDVLKIERASRKRCVLVKTVFTAHPGL